MLGIIGAMTAETEQLIAEMSDAKKHDIWKLSFYEGTLRGHRVVIANGAYGKVSAAAAASVIIERFKADRIINSGVAGGLLAQMKQGDFAVAKGFVQHDADTSALGDPRGMVSGLEIVEFPCDEKMSSAIAGAAAETGATHTGIIATGDQFIADDKKAGDIAGHFSAIACEMEGGAIAQVCYMAGVPFAALRCISDNADGAAGMSYPEFMELAAKKSSSLLIKLLENNII